MPPPSCGRRTRSSTPSTSRRLLKETAPGQGRWTPDLGYGVIDVAAAVAKAPLTTPSTPPKPAARATSKLLLLAFPTYGKAPLKVRMTAVLRSSDPRVSAGDRELVLESFAKGRWRPATEGADVHERHGGVAVLAGARRLPRPCAVHREPRPRRRQEPDDRSDEPLALDALDARAEPAQPLVDALVAAVDLRRRCRSSTCPRRRGSRSASPCRRGCPGSPCARRTAAPAR